MPPCFNLAGRFGVRSFSNEVDNEEIEDEE